MTRPDWVAWHAPYGDPDSYLSRRLALVQREIDAALNRCPPGPVRVVSMCAGQGRDLLEVLPSHSRRADVTARLVELDPRNAAVARSMVADRELERVEVVEADAGETDSYLGAVPADVVLACGIFGNISDEDIHQTINTLPQLCAPGASVIWTRHRQPPDLTPTIRGWFEDAQYEEVAFHAPADMLFSVGVNRFSGIPQPLQPGRQFFVFFADTRQ